MIYVRNTFSDVGQVKDLKNQTIKDSGTLAALYTCHEGPLPQPLIPRKSTRDKKPNKISREYFE